MRWGLRTILVAVLACTATLVLAAAGPGAPPRAATPPGAGACGVPAASPLWVDFADGSVPFWREVFARPGIVAAASNTLVPPQERAAGAATVYFDLKLVNRVGTPAKPLEPSVIRERADKLFDAAVASTGCATPIIAENELNGADLVTPWTTNNAQYRANILAYLTRVAERGAQPYLLISRPPYTDGDAATWWLQVSKVASIVPEVYFAAPQLSKQGPILASRRVRTAFRKNIAAYTALGIPPARLGLVLGFQVAPGVGGREGLKPSSAWFRVVKWQALAAKQVAAETGVGTIWSWGWGTWSAPSTDPDKPAAACVYLWVRDPSLCDGPSAAGAGFEASLTEGQINLARGIRCTVNGQPLTDRAIAALAAVTRDSELAESALFTRLSLTRWTSVSTAEVLTAERAIVGNAFGGSRSAYLRALQQAHASLTQARGVIADELRRAKVARTLRTPAPSGNQILDFYESYATTKARAVTAKPAPFWLGGSQGYALEPVAPAAVFATQTGKKTTIRTPLGTVALTAREDTEELGELPLGLVRPSIANALRVFARDGAYSRWLMLRQNGALQTTLCVRDELPSVGVPELEAYMPFLAF